MVLVPNVSFELQFSSWEVSRDVLCIFKIDWYPTLQRTCQSDFVRDQVDGHRLVTSALEDTRYFIARRYINGWYLSKFFACAVCAADFLGEGSCNRKENNNEGTETFILSYVCTSSSG